MQMRVRSENSAAMVLWIRASVSRSTAAVASSSKTILACTYVS